MALVSKEQREKMKKKLGLTDAEVEALIKADKEVDAMKDRDVDNDMTDEQKAFAKKYRNTGTRQVAAKAPTVYNLDASAKQKREDVTKEGLVKQTAEFLTALVQNLQIVNPSREISFDLNGESFSFTLIRHTKKK